MIFDKNSPDNFTLKENHIHLWFFNSEDAQSYEKDLARFLSADERERAGKFVRRELTRSYNIFRGALRLILSRYLGTRPESISFSYQKNGKPYIAAKVGKNNIDFNLSHADHHALFAFSQSKSVGVDIEKIREQTDVDGLARYFLPEKTLTWLSSLAPGIRAGHFYQFWSRAEALIKATGFGLGVLDAKTLPDVTKTSPVVCQFKGESWLISDIHIDDGHSAAVCSKGRVHALRGFLLGPALMKAFLKES